MKQDFVKRVADAMWDYDPYCGLFRSEIVEQLEQMDAHEIVQLLESLIEEDESGDVEDFTALLLEITAAA